MSSIAAPSRTEGRLGAAAPTVDRVRFFRLLAGGLALSGILVTMTPFEEISADGVETTGNIVNQLGYSGLAALALAAHLTTTPRRVALSLLSPAWLVMALWLFAGATNALDPAASTRAAFFTVAAMIATTGALCLPASTRDFRIALTIAATAVIVMSYGGLVLKPSLAIHQAVGSEAAHAGLWRGIYSHKNIAGAVFGGLFFVGVYLSRCRERWTGLLIALASAVFVLKTGSKTALGLLPLVALLVAGAGMAGRRGLAVAAIVAMLVLLSLATLGTVMVPSLREILDTIAPGTTFTGRLEIWDIALRTLDGHGWRGFGLESFWRTSIIKGAEPLVEGYAWDPRGAVNGHNGFLDVALALGWPGLGFAVLVIAVLPLRDYLKAGSDAESRRLADMFLMILCYLLLNAFLESFLFARNNPVWLMLFLCVAGLRMLARHRPAGEG